MINASDERRLRDRRADAATAACSVRRWRWGLLWAGWCVIAASALLPGYYSPATAWRPSRTTPAFGALLTAATSVIEPHNLRLGAIQAVRFVAGGAVLLGVILVLLGPAYLALLRFRWARLLWPMSISILAVWLPPVIMAIDGRPGRRYLAGYYSLALGFTLVFAALFQVPWRGRLRRGFEPIVSGSV